VLRLFLFPHFESPSSKDSETWTGFAAAHRDLTTQFRRHSLKTRYPFSENRHRQIPRKTIGPRVGLLRESRKTAADKGEQPPRHTKTWPGPGAWSFVAGLAVRRRHGKGMFDSGVRHPGSCLQLRSLRSRSIEVNFAVSTGKRPLLFVKYGADWKGSCLQSNGTRKAAASNRSGTGLRMESVVGEKLDEAMSILSWFRPETDSLVRASRFCRVKLLETRDMTGSLHDDSV
jgi:hypothetical protein